MPQMDHTVKNMPQRTLIGFQKVFEARTAMQEIPKFWDEVWATYGANVFAGNPPATAQEKAFSDHEIGEFGVCVDDVGVGKLRYLIAGTYRGGDVPEGTVLYELPAGTWAVFDCNGPIPDSLQALTNWVYGQWLPGNPEFEMDGAASVEWYDPENDFASPELHTQLWVPVKPKGEKAVTDSPIQSYIQSQEPTVQPQLIELYALLREIMPEAEERISYGMPTFWKGRNILHFAAMKHHIGLYPGGEATTVFAERLQGYKTTKGSIHLPLGQPLPTDLIREIALWCWQKYRK